MVERGIVWPVDKRELCFQDSSVHISSPPWPAEYREFTSFGRISSCVTTFAMSQLTRE